jgi:hypothetical protein
MQDGMRAGIRTFRRSEKRMSGKNRHDVHAVKLEYNGGVE